MPPRYGLHHTLRVLFYGNRDVPRGARVKFGSGESTRDVGKRVDRELAEYVAQRRAEALGQVPQLHVQPRHLYTRKLLKWFDEQTIRIIDAQVPVSIGPHVYSFIDLIGERVDTGDIYLFEIKTGCRRGRNYSGGDRMTGAFASVPDTPFNRFRLQACIYVDGESKYSGRVSNVIVLVVNGRGGVAHELRGQPEWYLNNKEAAWRALREYGTV